MTVADIAVFSDTRRVDKLFSYLAHAETPVGARVIVPFGKNDKLHNGIVLGFRDIQDETKGIKSVRKVFDEPVWLTGEAIETAMYLKRRFFCTYKESLSLFLPPGLGLKFIDWVHLQDCDEQARKYIRRSVKRENIVKAVEGAGGSIEVLELRNALGFNISVQLKDLISAGILKRDHVKTSDVGMKTKNVLRTGDTEPELKGAVAIKAYSVISSYDDLTISEVCELTPCSRGVVDDLVKKGFVSVHQIEILRNPIKGREIPRSGPLVPTDEQKKVIDGINNGSGGFLLRGITGSGKTEVFLQVIEKEIANGKQAVCLVPEISLTPQMVDRFAARFGNRVAILHSALSIGERLDEWNRIRNGQAAVVIGARSAVFAPVRDLGIIIIDEEHESTYKSESSPRYHARDVAFKRAEIMGAKLVLASATPSIESSYAAERGELKYLNLSRRATNSSLADCRIVDMGAELREGNFSMFSRTLKSEIIKNKERGEQTILFLNRRGFSTFVSCRNCGFVISCPDCSVSLKYHRSGESLNCHYCGGKRGVPSVCPQCGSKYIKYFGSGTQKIEQELELNFPGLSYVRMDVDTTSTKNAHEKILAGFKSGGYDILLGTQMVTKGLDFNNVTLVGILAADMSLNIDDYRAAERTFALVTQASGRAGRGSKPGRAVIQTYDPGNETLLLAAAADYQSFYDSEIRLRHALYYPPFCDIVNVTVSGDKEDVLEDTVGKVYDEVLEILGGAGVCFRPQRNRIYQMNKRFRWHFWIKLNAADGILEKLSQVRSNKANVYFDLNPSGF